MNTEYAQYFWNEEKLYFKNASTVLFSALQQDKGKVWEALSPWPVTVTLFVNYKGKQIDIFVQLEHLNCLLGLLLISNYTRGQAALTPHSFDKALHG